MKTERMNWKGFTTFMIVGTALMCIFLYAVGNFGSGADNPKPDIPDSVDACLMCQQFLNKQLKAPKTAEYPPCYEFAVSSDSNIWTATAYVDAQNSFGALIRSDFVCKIEYQGNDYWKLIDMQVSNR